MPAGDRDARLRADGGTALQNRAHRFHWQLVQRHSQNGQRHDGLATHGINVRQGVGCGDATEIARVIHNRHEEVGGGDDAVMVVDLPDGRVVTGFRADKKLCVCGGFRLAGEKLMQDRRRELAPAATAMGQAGQSNGGYGHIGTFTRGDPSYRPQRVAR